MNLAKFQAQIVPTISLMNQDNPDDPNLVIHKDCIPYKPFTKKALVQSLQTTCTPIPQKQIAPEAVTR